jgi:hypothetical protein
VTRQAIVFNKSQKSDVEVREKGKRGKSDVEAIVL